MREKEKESLSRSVSRLWHAQAPLAPLNPLSSELNGLPDQQIQTGASRGRASRGAVEWSIQRGGDRDSRRLGLRLDPDRRRTCAERDADDRRATARDVARHGIAGGPPR